MTSLVRAFTRLTTPLVAFGVGFAVYPKDWRKGSLFDRQLTHINEDILSQIQATDEFKRLEADKSLLKYHSSTIFPAQHLKNYVGSGLLFGPDLNEIDPIVFLDEQKGNLTSFYHLGSKLISQDGQIHNGVVATILDEGLCACGFPLLPSRRGVTAKLYIDFVNQAPPNSTVVLRAKIKESKGRKVVISGNLETLLLNGEAAVKIADAECILVEPKWFRYFSWLQVV